MIQLRVKGSRRPALVDDGFEWVSKYAWSVNNVGYVQATVEGRHTYLQRLVLVPTPGRVVSFKNGDKFDCRLVNLREATRGQTQANKPAQRNCMSGLKGVFRTPNGRWGARCDGEYLGLFDLPEAAARAYDVAARAKWGEYARTNLP